MTNLETIRVGIVGAGANTRNRHIPNLQAIDGVEVVSVCNRSRASSERVAEQFGIPRVYDNWRELIAAPDTNAIVIGTWPYLHCRATLAALQNDKHVMVEARMAMNSAEASQMVAAAQAKPYLTTQVVPAPLSFAFDKTIQRLISEGYLGDLLAIEVRDHGGNFLDRESPLHWRQNRALSGLNVLNLGIWYETIVRWVGAAKTVQAMGKTFVNMRHDPEQNRHVAVHIPEHLTVIADMACGAQATFSMSSVTGLRHVQEAVLYGSEGTLAFDIKHLYGGRRGDDGLSEIEISADDRNVWRVEEDFVNAIRGLEPVRYTTFADGLNYMQFTTAVAESLAQRRAVTADL